MENKLPPVMTAKNTELQQYINNSESSARTYTIVSIEIYNYGFQLYNRIYTHLSIIVLQWKIVKIYKYFNNFDSCIHCSLSRFKLHLLLFFEIFM